MLPTIQDAHIRKQALDITQSFIVQAPAGSGKTELLTQRYLNLLSHAKKAPEEIIAITFTRKAAAEMRVRIMQALNFATQLEPDQNDYRHQTWSLAKKVLEKDAELDWEILQNPNRLRILTIDALSALLCRQTPLQTQFGGSFAVSDNSSALYQLAARRALTEVFTEAPYNKALEQLLLYLDNRVEHLEQLLSELLAERDQWLPTILYCYANHQTLQEMLENGLKRVILEKLQMAAAAMPENIKQLLVLCARHAGDYFKENDPRNPLAACADFTFEEKPALDKFPQWFGLTNLLLTKEGQQRKIVDIRNGFGPKDPNKSLMSSILTELTFHPVFYESLCDILICPPEKYTKPQWETLTSLTQLLPVLAAQLHVIFQEKKEIDFTELNLSALKALGDEESPTDLALYLDYQINHLLIDEFQDTSITHLHLLEKMIAGWLPGDGRTLFLVGDPMQSIYRFRNAEVGLFLRAQAQGIGPVSLTPLTLTMNFRSQGNLVTWFNDTFQTVFPALSDIATGRVPYTKAIAARQALDFSATLYPLISEDEAQVIVDQIMALKKNCPHDSMAILVRARAQLTPIIALLNKNNLAFQAVDIEPLFARPDIQDLLALTRAVLHRADRIAWIALLRAPFIGLLLTDLERIAQHSEKNTIWESLIDYENIIDLSNDAKTRISQLKYFLENAFETQSEHRLSSWIEGLWLALNGQATSQNIDHPRAYFDLLDKLENTAHTLSIKTLSDRCEKLYANTKSAEKNTIQLMTIHKSKGLEFDHVFLPGLERQSPHDKSKLLRFCDRPSLFGGDDLLIAPIASAKEKKDPIYDYLKEIESEKQTYEMSRLLYVAATRAKKSLHLSFTLVWNEEKSCIIPPKKGSFLEKLWPIYEKSIAVTPKNTTGIETREKCTAPFQRLSMIEPHPNNSKFKPTVKINIDSEDFHARIIGTVVHEALQALSNNKTTPDTLPIKKWRARLLSLGILPSHSESAVLSVETAIKNTLSDERGQWILSQTKEAHSEWALTTVLTNKLEKKIIDRCFIDENNVRWIIDYKTSQPLIDETLEAFLEKEKATYQEQLETYSALFSADHVIKLGLYFPMCKGWIAWDYFT
ncbi:MAG: UvrD-helicase domain-containing protein [Coxiellaceae bacterium]|nr:UvrD-helicase domain-containing protein [Coxiellaceae bacterium]